MSKIDRLVQRFEEVIALPWERNLAGPQKVWFIVYEETDERRLRARIDAFQLASQRAGHAWLLCDLTHSFPTWMAEQEYREAYFEAPEDLNLVLPAYQEYVQSLLKAELEQADENTLVAVLGVGTLFGFARLSEVLEKIHPFIHGRVAVFFPGEYRDNTYRLLDARSGWDYLALPITA